jgi:hypothetical protein
VHYKKSKKIGDRRIDVVVRLDDTCGNGHETWSVTGDLTHPLRNSGGCIHEEIALHFPELRSFIPLHGSDMDGCPMQTVANAFFWYGGMLRLTGAYLPSETVDVCRRRLKNHLRNDDLSPLEEFGARTEDELSYVLDRLGFRQQWKQESQRHIHALEFLTGDVFVSSATRSNWPPLPADKTVDIEMRMASGYFAPDKVAARDEEARASRRKQRLAEADRKLSEGTAVLSRQWLVDTYLARRDLPSIGVTYYERSNTLVLPWPKEEFLQFVATVNASELPMGIKFKLK